MDNELNEVLIDAIQKTQAGLSKGVDFVVEQSPELIQQILAWNMITSALSMVLWVALSSLLVVVLRKTYKHYHVSEAFREGFDAGGFLLIVVVVPIFVLGVTVATWSLDWLQIIIAPKL